MNILAKLLLKARPTLTQLRDRLRPPWPDGLELYLDVADLSDDNWAIRLYDLVMAFALPTGFTLIVEGPLRSLDGSYFDLTADTPANRELVDRLIGCGRSLGAAAANIHLVAPVTRCDGFTRALHAATLKRTLSLLGYYVEHCEAAGLIPLVENMPPVLRMREGAFVYSIIGVEPGDFPWLAMHFPSLRVTLDLSHAQLAVNAARIPPETADPSVQPLLRYLRGEPPSPLPGGEAPSDSSRGLPLRSRPAPTPVARLSGLRNGSSRQQPPSTGWRSRPSPPDGAREGGLRSGSPQLQPQGNSSSPIPAPVSRATNSPSGLFVGEDPLTLEGFVDALAPLTVNVHVSNAAGLLGEGLPYFQGEADLDPIVARLLGTARFIVTETLEPDPDDAVHMREVQAAIRELPRRMARGGVSFW
ncbi:MAG: hypothetical protein HYY04_18390 [Chloroflexi bacterium]|nr:hypothetical protein [Chloroflexota bacterium]